MRGSHWFENAYVFPSGFPFRLQRVLLIFKLVAKSLELLVSLWRIRLEELLRQPTEQIVVTVGFLQIPGHIHLKGEGADEGAIAGTVLVLEHPHAMLALTSVPSSEDQVSVVDAEMVHQDVL